MAPIRPKKRKSDPTITNPQPTNSPSRTPIRSPSKRAPTITLSQKQALIDNLQLEVTERARKLRAQYALQAQSLRTRIELRVNRIPTSLRKAIMGELLQKYLENPKPGPKSIPVDSKPAKTTAADKPTFEKPVAAIAEASQDTSPLRTRGTKRKSLPAISSDLEAPDKENIHPIDALPNPKKRTKATTTTAVATKPHLPPQPTPLSPKSLNSRTLPHSPVHPSPTRPTSPLKPSYNLSPQKPTSPIKPALPAPQVPTTSPLKPTLPTTTTTKAAKQTRSRAPAARKPTAASTIAAKPTTTVTRPKRGAAATKQDKTAPQEQVGMRVASNISVASGTSTATTLVKKGPGAGTKGAAKKNVGVAPTVAASATVGRRVLRKRG